jgi:hypothetical protein
MENYLRIHEAYTKYIVFFVDLLIANNGVLISSCDY